LTGPMRCRRQGPLRGAIAVPGDKSVSHRALLFGALATGETRVTGLLDAEDVHSTRKAVERLGATVRSEGREVVVVPPERLREPDDVLDCGNSGTSLRLLTGVLSGVPGLSVLTGDGSLRRRPVRRVIEPLRRMGANLSARDGDRVPPVVVRGGPLRGARHVLEVASAQVKSALLLSGLYADGPTRVVEPGPSRDHTERMLSALGVSVERDGLAVTLDPSKGKLRWRGFDLRVPGDPSSAAFAVVAAAMMPGSEITVRDVCVNETRTGFLDVAHRMGLPIEIREEDGGASGERVATLVARHAVTKATEIEEEALIVRLIDEIPVLCALAAVAEGTTRIRGAAELRVKESDRIAVMVSTLRAFGVECEEHPDGMDIVGGKPLHGATIESHHDHRIAMTGALLGMIADGETVVNDTDCVGTSFPSFVSLFRGLGADIVEEEA
jgi:3-phosphoshikimate 1-carboxyvinyltransferase